MRLQNYLIALVLFSVIIGGVSLAYVSLQENYGFTQGPYDLGVYDVLNETQQLSLDISEQIQTGEVTEADFFTTSVKGVLTAVRMIGNNVKFTLILMGDIVELFGLDDLFLTAAIAILLILISFAIISAIMKWAT